MMFGALPAQQLIFRFELAAFAQRARQLDLRAHDRQQPLVVPRLRHEIARAAFHRFHREIDRRPRRHDHDRQSVIDRLDLRNHLQAFLARGGVARVIQIHHQERVISLLQRIENSGERSDRVRLVSLALEQNAQRLQHIALIIRNQNSATGYCEPRFTRLSMW